jgi:cytochrome c-type biogenesis protein CcmH
MSRGLPVKAGTARLYLALSAVALSASLLVSLLALAPHLHSGSLVALGAENEARPPAAEAIDSAADADTYVRRLRAHLERQPRDARAWVILARLEADLDRFDEAAQAYDKALALSSKVAADPAVWCEYADALGMTQGGSLAGRPREFIERALALNPNHPKALEMAGSSEYAQGDYAAALRYWRPLLAAQKPGSRAYAELAAAIARSERLGATPVAAMRYQEPVAK